MLTAFHKQDSKKKSIRANISINRNNESYLFPMYVLQNSSQKSNNTPFSQLKFPLFSIHSITCDHTDISWLRLFLSLNLQAAISRSGSVYYPRIPCINQYCSFSCSVLQKLTLNNTPGQSAIFTQTKNINHKRLPNQSIHGVH